MKIHGPFTSLLGKGPTTTQISDFQERAMGLEFGRRSHRITGSQTKQATAESINDPNRP